MVVNAENVLPLEDAARFLVGFEDGRERDCYVIDATWDKRLDFSVKCPVKDIVNAPDQMVENSIYNYLMLISQVRPDPNGKEIRIKGKSLEEA